MAIITMIIIIILTKTIIIMIMIIKQQKVYEKLEIEIICYYHDHSQLFSSIFISVLHLNGSWAYHFLNLMCGWFRDTQRSQCWELWLQKYSILDDVGEGYLCFLKRFLFLK